MFSLNFSSVGKEPFLASKAKNAPETALSCGEGVSGERGMALHSLGNLGVKFSEMSFPHFKTYFTQIGHCYL